MARPAPTPQGLQPPGPPSSHRPPRLRWLTAPFRRAWRWFAHQPRALQVGLVVVVLGGLAVGGYYGRSYLKKRATARDVASAWGEYANAMRKADLDGVRAALDHVEAVNPGDPAVARFKAILDRGEADADTPDLAQVLLRHHLGNNRLPEAAREAEKVLAKSPKDWTAHCALAAHALLVLKDRALTEKWLDQLPDPEDPAAAAGPAGLNYVLKLSAEVGHDAGPLRRVVVRRLLPFLRGAAAAELPAVA